jgi:hypothetical protein
MRQVVRERWALGRYFLTIGGREQPLTVSCGSKKSRRRLHVQRIAGGDAIDIQRSCFTLNGTNNYRSRKEAS